MKKFKSMIEKLSQENLATIKGGTDDIHLTAHEAAHVAQNPK